MRVRIDSGKRYCRDSNESDRVQIIMLSGGADSCALLIKQLVETNYQIHAHHIQFENIENRQVAESQSVKNIVSFCRDHYRGFAFSSNVLTWPDIAHTGYLSKDTIMFGFVAGNVCRSIQVAMTIDCGKTKPIEVLFGAVQEDLRKQDPEDYLQNDPKCVGRRMAFQSHFVDEMQKGNDIPTLCFPLLNIPKMEVFKTIPDELKKHLNSCRMPHYLGGKVSVPCGVCGTCRQFQDV